MTENRISRTYNKSSIWFVTGSQHLYGEEALKEVADDARRIVQALNAAQDIPVEVRFRNVVTSSDEIENTCLQASADPDCIGLIVWMHTFSPAKMWIRGLSSLKKPFVHFHTQGNRDIPWSSIDMDFMNLNQAAHGGREFGFICSRMRIERTVIVGHWQDPEVLNRLGIWARAAIGWSALRSAKIARFGDNMREVAVTEGDKVEAQMRFGVSVNGYGVGELAARMEEVKHADISALVNEYLETYSTESGFSDDDMAMKALKESAKMELGMRAFLEEGDFSGFTDTFEDLYGFSHLPGLAVQRLMKDGYGFAAEGDWKTAALLYTMKTMAFGLEGGTSFMEDYTYHFEPNNMSVLGAHMLEVCPSIAAEKPSLQIHPLAIGGKADPPRLVFQAAPGKGFNAALMDMGNRFRLVANRVEVISAEQEMPKLPVARALWRPMPDLKTAAAAWILSGAAHHSSFTQALSLEHLEDFAEMAGIELIEIDEGSTVHQIKNELRWNEAAYR